MKIDRELIQKIASAARLNLTEDEAERFLPQIKEVLESFSKLDEADCKNTKSSFQPVEIKNILRTDSPSKCLTQEQALSLTEHQKGGYFRGPKAL